MSGGFIGRFLAHVDQVPDRVAVEIVGGETLTYAELLASCERLRGIFVELGVERGDRILVALASGPEFVAAFYALASLGAVAVVLSERLTRHELVPMLADALPGGAVVGSKRGRELVLSATDLAFVLDLDPYGPDAGSSPHLRNVGSFTHVRPQELAPPSDDQDVSCHFTYKGLGYPLGALHTYGNYSRCVDALTRTYPGTAHDNLLVVLPMQPIYGLVSNVLAPLASGQRLVILQRPTDKSLVELAAHHRIRFLCVIPMMAEAMVQAARRLGRRARDMLRPDMEIACGGSDLSAATADAVAESLGLELLQGYGTTETLLVAVSPPGGARSDAVGLLLDDTIAIRVVAEDGMEIPRPRTGRITIATPTIMSGYIGRPKETERFLDGGAFVTGDLGHVRDDGYLAFDGRWLPFGKSFGQMVDFVELEAVARSHPKVADARASTNPDPSGERVALAVLPKSAGAELTERELGSFLRERLSTHKVPRRIQISGKVR